MTKNIYLLNVAVIIGLLIAQLCISPFLAFKKTLIRMENFNNYRALKHLVLAYEDEQTNVPSL